MCWCSSAGTVQGASRRRGVGARRVCFPGLGSFINNSPFPSGEQARVSPKMSSLLPPVIHTGLIVSHPILLFLISTDRRCLFEFVDHSNVFASRVSGVQNLQGA